MRNQGYIILPRAIIDDAYFSQKFTKAQALIDLYFLAAYTDRTFYIRGNKVELKRGQLAVAEQNLAERWKWSRNTVRKFLEELSKTGKIEQQKSRVVNVISLNFYGITEQQDEQQDEQQNEQPIKKGKRRRNNKPPLIPPYGSTAEQRREDAASIIARRLAQDDAARINANSF